VENQAQISDLIVEREAHPTPAPNYQVQMTLRELKRSSSSPCLLTLGKQALLTRQEDKVSQGQRELSMIKRFDNLNVLSATRAK
jgi:hypothetical protein